MAQRFSDDDHGYRRWLFAHPGGFVLNESSPSKLTLHAAGCSALGDPEGDTALTSVAKVCDITIDGLERWAHGEHGTDPEECTRCAPYSHQTRPPGAQDPARTHPGSRRPT